jgi:hypothetical protein
VRRTEKRHDEAVETLLDAAELWRGLASDKPVLNTADLTVILRNLGRALRGAGRSDEALYVEAEAVQWWKDLASQHPQFEDRYRQAWIELSRSAATRAY